MGVIVAPGIEIPDSELEFSAIRASGPGGQNVNKVSSAIQLRYDVAASHALTAPVRERLRRLAGRRMALDGSLLITARTHRSQEQNRAEAIERLVTLVRDALVAPKARRATRPTRASRERRLEGKAHRQQTKQRRQRRFED